MMNGAEDSIHDIWNKFKDTISKIQVTFIPKMICKPGKRNTVISRKAFVAIKDNLKAWKNYKYNRKANYSEIKVTLEEYLQKMMNGAEDSIHDIWNKFKDTISKIQVTFIPKMICKPGKRNTVISRKAFVAIKDNLKAWKNYKYNRNTMSYETYKKARNLATKEIVKCKYNREKQVANEVKNNPKTFWQYVNERTKNRTGINSIEVNGKLTYRILSDYRRAQQTLLYSFYT